MKKYLVLVIAVFTTVFTSAQRYIPNDAGSAVTFIIKSFGLNVTGNFMGLQGSIAFNPSDSDIAHFNVTIEAGTVNTGNRSRDGHLKGEEYFNSSAFPKINIVFTRITVGSKAGSYLFEGVAIIKGMTKNISFSFTAIAVNEIYHFEGSFKINRRDFNVGGSSLVLGDVLSVNLNVSAIKGRLN